MPLKYYSMRAEGINHNIIESAKEIPNENKK
jgi:hypothetical protein